MMVRRAVLSDKPRVIRLLKHSRDAAGFDSADGLTGFTFPFDPAYAEAVFLLHVEEARNLCLVLNVDATVQGVLMAASHPHPFGPVWLARETVWWIEPDHRGSAAPRMLAAYEEWAADRGCHFVGMAGMGADPDVGRLYERRGYRVAETYYLKAVA
jgi:GNAT superfamily N-acetyltransferase